ncbi:MAG: hypothetical protein IJW48_03050 [Clostridia bacterium]|nr:hypothetical protein [Clostridia bacterium]
MFFTNYSTYEGEPIRLYRTPEEIGRDIGNIKEKIEKTGNMLNVRSILCDMIAECAEGDPERWLPALRAVVTEAEETLELLRSFKESLDMLEGELEDTRCMLGI